MTWSTAPEVATPAMMARVMATFYVFGGVAGLLAAWAIDGHPTARQVMIGLSLSGLVCAGASVRWGRWWPRWVIHLAVAWATALIIIGVVVAPDPVTAVVCAALLSFAAVDAFFSFCLPAAYAHVVVGVGGVTAALLLRGEIDLPLALALDAVILALGTATRGLVLRASSASRDPLTGLANRRGLDDALQQAVDRARRSGDRLSAALLDLDFFKQVNDTGGHEAGDRVLCQVADTWRRELPEGAVLARQGGDEFGLLLPGTGGPDALALVRRIAALHPEIGLSIGVAEHHVGQSAADLVRRADRALYDAKAAGRDRAELEGGSGSELAGDLAAALAAGDVEVHLQPISSLRGAEVVGVEALARWTHAERGPVPPLEFVAVAEQTGLIRSLGEHVMRTACAQLAGVRTLSGSQVTLGVNVSGRELSDPGYPQQVRDVLAATGFPAGHLVLEVTESLLEGQSPAALAALHELRADGLKVSIDDFGTGYSSLSRLDTLPADVLKLDRSFIADLGGSTRRAQMLHGLVAMCAGLGLDVVAEGVETPEQEAVVRAVGCTFGQGWLYGRPVPVADLLALLGVTDVLGSLPARSPGALLVLSTP